MVEDDLLGIASILDPRNIRPILFGPKGPTKQRFIFGLDLGPSLSDPPQQDVAERSIIPVKSEGVPYSLTELFAVIFGIFEIANK